MIVDFRGRIIDTAGDGMDAIDRARALAKAQIPAAKLRRPPAEPRSRRRRSSRPQTPETPTANIARSPVALSRLTPRRLRCHAGFGCLSVISHVAKRWSPFVFISHGRVVKGTMRLALLIYCRSIDEFVANAGPLGRYLLRCGFPAVALDAMGPLPGLPGYFNRGPRLYRGPHPPHLGDLAYTELVIFGL